MLVVMLRAGSLGFHVVPSCKYV